MPSSTFSIEKEVVMGLEHAYELVGAVTIFFYFLIPLLLQVFGRDILNWCSDYISLYFGKSIEKFIAVAKKRGYSEVTVKLSCICYSGGFADIGAGDESHFYVDLVAGTMKWRVCHIVSQEWIDLRGPAQIAALRCWRNIVDVFELLICAGFKIKIDGGRNEIVSYSEAQNLVTEYELNVPKFLEENNISEKRAANLVKTKLALRRQILR